MKFTKLETKEQFNKLKKDDPVLVNWGINIPPELYQIYGLINDDKELLLCKSRNHYFIISMYLDGKSSAKEAYLVTQEASE